MIAALLVSACVASTNVEAFKDSIQRACGEGIQSIQLTQDGEGISYEMVFSTTRLPKRNSHLQVVALGQSAAALGRDVHAILSGLFPHTRIVLDLRDGNRRPICRIVWDEDGKDQGACRLLTVEDQ